MSSYVSAVPEMMTSAAADLATIGSDLSAAHTAAAASSVAVIPAAADEVSAAISAVFGRYAPGYQTLAGRAAAFHDQFVHNLSAGAASYASTEATNDSSGSSYTKFSSCGPLYKLCRPPRRPSNKVWSSSTRSAVPGAESAVGRRNYGDLGTRSAVFGQSFQDSDKVC